MPRSLVESLNLLLQRLRPPAGQPSLTALTGLRQSSTQILLGLRELEMQTVQRGWKGDRRGELQRIPCPALDPELPLWRGALSALESNAGAAPVADVVLSSELVRYAVVPWVAGMDGGDAQQAYVRHNFAQAHGSAAELWTIRYFEQKWGKPYLATAVETALLEALRDGLATRAVQVRSVQSLFSWAYNRWCGSFEGDNYWFVSAEPRRLVIGRVADGHWEGVHSHRIQNDWTHLLPVLLTRARLQSPSAGSGGHVYVATPGLDGQLVVGDWQPNGLLLPLPGIPAQVPPAAAEAAG